MLFNSVEFIFGFLPVALGVFVLLQYLGLDKWVYAWISASSLFFYAWWNPGYAWLLLVSIIGNFLLGRYLFRSESGRSKGILLLGVVVNLAIIGYYKYSVFILTNVGFLAGKQITVESILLPLGISFFTFQQISYLVDANRKESSDYSFFHYFSFVTFFPQLIAGPIVHHWEMMPQFDRQTFSLDRLLSNAAIGASIFIIGLFKKVCIADPLAEIATPTFAAAAGGATVTFFDAWFAALGYTFQLYFDFSGYSDMAIGLARLFGIVLPLNFLSPYKASSIIDFWRRWHITLSRFLRDYVYIALGGNRKGFARCQINLLITMLFGGIWHGAGWTFIAWGGGHGLLLCANHVWNKWIPARSRVPRAVTKGAGWALTFGFVVVGWVLFRAESLAAAGRVFEGMFLGSAVVIPERLAILAAPLSASAEIARTATGAEAFASHALWITAAGMLAFFGKNVAEIFAAHRPVLGDSVPGTGAVRWWSWKPNLAWAVFLSVLLYLSLQAILVTTSSEFLYFNF